MRSSILLIGAIVGPLAVFASPLEPASAGSVVTNNGVKYEMSRLNEIKAFDNKVDNGNYPRPATYTINVGFSCSFYTESTRGCGSSIGELAGPTNGSFNTWIQCYKCTTVNPVETRAAPPEEEKSIPCGWVGTSNGGTSSLVETGNMFQDPKDFASNGEYYYPVKFHVAKGCTCGFYTTATARGGPEMILESKGMSDGDFGGKRAAKYACWIGE